VNRHLAVFLFAVVLALATRPLLAAPAARSAPASQIKPLLEQVPESAQAAMVVDLSSFAFYRQIFDKAPQMRRDLRAYLQRALGVDLTQISGLAFWAIQLAPELKGALFLRVKESGSLKGKRLTVHRQIPIIALDGKKLVAATLPAGVVLGQLATVRAAIDLNRRAGRPLSKRAPLGGLFDEARPEVHVLGGLSNALFSEPELRATVDRFGVRLVTLTFDQKNRITLSAAGDPARMRVALTTLEQLIRAAEGQLAKQKELSSSQNDVLAAIGAIIGYHQWRAFIAEARPREIGGKLVASYTLPEMGSPWMLSSVAGILAAVAVPAFVKYTRRAKTVEATEGLEKIGLGAKAFFQADHYDRAGKLLQKQFPPGDTGWVPKRSCCGKAGSKCQPDQRAWNVSPWRELHFQLSDPHYYQFRYSSRGSNKQATFTAEARGDLNCDGRFSSYKVYGSVDAELNVTIRGPVIAGELE
jgi:hypothetical protein